MFGMSMDIGIDLGTANVLIYVKNKGIVLREPSVVAVDKDTNQVLAIGEEARRMIGRTPGNIVAIRPLKEGVIADYDITESMLRHFIEKVVGHSFVFRPRIMICIPSGCTMVEQRAVQEAAEQVGLSRSSFYKYKDDILPFSDNTRGKTVTLVTQMMDEPGLLSDLLHIVADYRANILTIHQTIPVNGSATVTLSVEVLSDTGNVAGMVEEIEHLKGVQNVKILGVEK